MAILAAAHQWWPRLLGTRQVGERKIDQEAKVPMSRDLHMKWTEVQCGPASTHPRGETRLSSAAKVNGRQGGWGVTRFQQLPRVPASQAQNSLQNGVSD